MACCVHCGICFITDPRNAGRCDLRCPFGCREAHRKQCSTRRSVEYYRTEDGKEKKKLQNDKRTRSESAPEDRRSEGEEKPSEENGQAEGKEKLPEEDRQLEGEEKPPEEYRQLEGEEKPPEEELLGGELDGSEFDEGMVSYVRMVTSLIEGRRVSRDEILRMLVRTLRQHSMARRKRTDYRVWYLNENPP
jgi:chromatin remodeling complex protein RSC6